MKIEIPITELEARELTTILRKYPNGKVKVDNKKAIWECELDLSNQPQQSSQPQQSNQQPGFTGKSNVFSNMAESITDAFAIK